MNYRSVASGMAIFLLFLAQSNAQQGKPSNPEIISQPDFFDQIPQRTPCSTSTLESLFKSGAVMTLPLGPGFLVHGEPMTEIRQNASTKTINFRLSELPGALLTISQIILDDGTIKYTGHVTKAHNRSAIVLTSENGKYFFNKTEQRLLLSE